MITLITGNNSYGIKQKLVKLKSDFADKYGSEGIRVADAADIDVAQLASFISNNSLFSQDLLVIISNIDDNKSIAEYLPTWLEKVDGSTHLVLVTENPDKRVRWYRSAVKLGKAEVIDELNEPELVRWAQQKAKDLGATLETADARLLITRTGLNQSQVSNELDKLANYSLKINRQNIELLVDKTLEESVFDLIDSVIKGRTKRAQLTYDNLRLTDMDPHKFIGLMSWQLHNLLIVKTNNKKTSGELAAKAAMAPFVVDKTRRLTMDLTLEQIKRIIELTLQADADIKQTGADSDSRIKLLIDQVSLAVN